MTRSREPEPSWGPLELPDASAAEQRRPARDREPDAFAGRADEHPALRISYDEDLDFLTALVPGAVVDEPFDEQLMTAFAWREDDDGDLCERAWLFHPHADGPLFGFGVRDAFAWELAGEDPDAAVWATPRFDVPSLALRGASVGEIVLAAQRTITGSTPDVVEFGLAVAAGTRGDLEQAEQHWRACLACDDMTAHYGLGYTLIDLGRPREAFGHLAMYTEICPRNAWGWAFRGRAAQRMGELSEARRAYRTARGYETAGAMDTNAAIWLAELDAETSHEPGATMTTTHPAPPAMVTPRFTEALEYARAHHAAQRRKGTTIPYLAHLLAVSAIVLEHGGSETAAIAALLHDVVEDGGGERALTEIEERFGPDVAAIVAGCSDTTTTDKEDWTLRKTRYLAHLEAAGPDVLLVSGADKLHNARSIHADLREHGDELWKRFNRGARPQLWYYGALRDTFLRRMPGALADELDRTVREIECHIDPQDRVAWLGFPCEFWSTESGAAGAFIDYQPGCPLVVEETESGLQVRAQVGSGGDYCPDVDDDLEDLITVDLGDLRVEYLEPQERAWLISDDHGDLRDACRRVAALAPLVIEQLREAGDLDAPITSYEERLQEGPWR